MTMADISVKQFILYILEQIYHDQAKAKEKAKEVLNKFFVFYYENHLNSKPTSECFDLIIENYKNNADILSVGIIMGCTVWYSYKTRGES